MKGPYVSVVVVNWNTCELTSACLDSLEAAVDDDVALETIVVDNGSTDGSLEMLRARADIVLIANPDNRGFAVAVNQGYACARGELILLLNSDVVVRPGALGALVRFLERTPTVAGVGPLYVNPDGSPQQHHYRFPTFTMIVAASSAVFRRVPPFAGSLRTYRMLDQDFSAPVRVAQPSASCLLLRRSALSGDRLLDERYPIYFNDVVLARALAYRGHELWVTPDAVVVHAHGASTELLGGQLRRQHLASLVRYLGETQPPWRVAIFRAVVFAQKVVLWALRRPGAMPLRDLVAALRGDPGPLPKAPLL